MNRYGVIMAGGGGTRFWPLSRKAMPKQLLNLSGKERMVNETIDRVSTVVQSSNIFVVTNELQVQPMKDVTVGRVQPDHILSEPQARNTSACIGYAAMEILKKYGDGVMTIFPSDHFIKNTAEFTRILGEACDAAEREDCLVTIGITPTYPCTGYGYIQYDHKEEGVIAHKVREFKEKPDLETAQRYVDSHDYAWNSGMFVWKASVILEHFKQFLPDVYACLEQMGDVMGTEAENEVINKIYPTIPSVSIDYGIMEKATNVKVIAADMGWSDVGSWDNLGVIYDEDKDGNIFAGNHISIDTTGCVTYSQKRMIATVGVSDIIIVETEDAILVCDKNRAQDVKLIVDELANKQREDLL